jgi:hypothetical protein
MNAVIDRLTAQIQQFMTMVQALGKQSYLPLKLQRQPPRTSPMGLTLQDVQVMTSESPPCSPYQNRSTSPALSPARSIPPEKYVWADQHEDDDEMETVEYGAGKKERTKLPRGNNKSTRGYGWEYSSTHPNRSDAESLANNSGTPSEENSKGIPMTHGCSDRANTVTH